MTIAYFDELFFEYKIFFLYPFDTLCLKFYFYDFNNIIPAFLYWYFPNVFFIFFFSNFLCLMYNTYLDFLSQSDRFTVNIHVWFYSQCAILSFLLSMHLVFLIHDFSFNFLKYIWVYVYLCVPLLHVYSTSVIKPIFSKVFSAIYFLSLNPK